MIDEKIIIKALHKIIKKKDIVAIQSNSLVWKIDKSIELKYQNDTYPLVANTDDGYYKIVKIHGGYSAKFISTGQSVGRRIGYNPPTLREAKRECEEDFQNRLRRNASPNEGSITLKSHVINN